MIVLTRVDHRLLHGQVAVSWTTQLNADCILIANDNVVNDELRKTTIKLAKPHGVKLVIKTIADSIEAINSGITDKYKLFIVVESVKDAAELVRNVKQIKSINLGGTKPKENTQFISKAVSLTNEEIATLKELISEDIEIEIRQVPAESKAYAKDLI
jgi:fructoselysine and glucoselysine-specific PTS system IIB component